jgi:hypothetical protein
MGRIDFQGLPVMPNGRLAPPHVILRERKSSQHVRSPQVLERSSQRFGASRILAPMIVLQAELVVDFG